MTNTDIFDCIFHITSFYNTVILINMESNVILMNPFKHSKVPTTTDSVLIPVQKKKSEHHLILPEILKMISTLSDKIDKIDTKIDTFIRDFSQHKKTANSQQSTAMYPEHAPSFDYDS